MGFLHIYVLFHMSICVCLWKTNLHNAKPNGDTVAYLCPLLNKFSTDEMSHMQRLSPMV